MKKALLVLAFAIFVGVCSIELGFLLTKIPIVYYEKHKKTEYENIAQQIQNRMDFLAACLKTPTAKIMVIDSATLPWYMRPLAPQDRRAYAVTRLKSLWDVVRKKTHVVVINKDIASQYFTNEYNRDQTLAHELGHQIFEPTLYHSAILAVFWPRVINQEKENLLDDFADAVIKRCVKPSKPR